MHIALGFASFAFQYSERRILLCRPIYSVLVFNETIKFIAVIVCEEQTIREIASHYHVA